jgi:THUMP domain-like
MMPGSAATQAPQLLADCQWLVSPAAEAVLARASAEPDLFARTAALRRELTAERARLVLEQVALRERGLKKFARAPRLFFTPLGLEQATDGWISNYKAQRFSAGGRVLDFCCGIGGDLMALALRGPVVGIDRDPVSALFAEANCRAMGASDQGTGRVSEVAAELLAPDDLWHIDPDRRSTGRRTTHVEAHDPPAETIDRLLTVAPAGAIKLAPAAEIPLAWREAAESEWISSARQCRQLVAWFGPLAQFSGADSIGLHRATLISRTGDAPASIVGKPHVECPVAATIGRYVYDPDPAVVAAGLIGAVSGEHGLAALVAGGAYLTADRLTTDPLLAAFAVSEVMPWDVRRLKRVLRERQIGRLEVKQRGTRHDPAVVQRELKVPGDASATVILFRRGKSVVAILAQRVGAAGQSSRESLS